ncbi:MAG: dUTP pyrophosphatase, partial [Gaiellales bacterium]|nr:dUTP pyrophosphatase [Gaiellales bacterium]
TDRTEPFAIGPGDRVAQLVLVRVSLADAVEVEALDATERGDGGFGSSGGFAAAER